MLPDDAVHVEAFDYYQSLKRVRKHFERSYSQPVPLIDAANIAGMEAKHFGKFFHQKVGIGFKEWTNRVRVAIAIQMIGKEHQSLTDVAFAVGFQDFRTFERAFKKCTGLTPREFRRTIMERLDRIA